MALGSVRVMSTLATLGQVCGTAAAMCLQYGETPKSLGLNRLKELQQRLLRDDLYIPGVKNEDSHDGVEFAAASLLPRISIRAVVHNE